jgi:hypothetical protein
MAKATGHVVAEELSWVVVELVCFVAVDGFLGLAEVDWGFAG